MSNMSNMSICPECDEQVFPDCFHPMCERVEREHRNASDDTATDAGLAPHARTEAFAKAALDAVAEPDVKDWIWCGFSEHDDGGCSQPRPEGHSVCCWDGCDGGVCPGPHRSLLIGPVLDAVSEPVTDFDADGHPFDGAKADLALKHMRRDAAVEPERRGHYIADCPNIICADCTPNRRSTDKES